MELKKVSQFEPVISPELKKPTGLDKGGPSFADTLNGLQGGLQKPNLQKLSSAEPVKFSNHAVERMMSRGISFSKEDMGRLNEAVDRASAKGSKDSLILMNDSALIVSVKNRTVVTVMDKNALKENVFTNIDSTIVM
jgi:flagellar operon protein